MFAITSDDCTVVIQQGGHQRLSDGNLLMVKDYDSKFLDGDGPYNRICIRIAEIMHVALSIRFFYDQLLKTVRKISGITEI